MYINKHENALAVFNLSKLWSRRRYRNVLLINNVLDNKFRHSCNLAAVCIGMPARYSVFDVPPSVKSHSSSTRVCVACRNTPFLNTNCVSAQEIIKSTNTGTLSYKFLTFVIFFLCNLFYFSYFLSLHLHLLPLHFLIYYNYYFCLFIGSVCLPRCHIDEYIELKH